MKRLVSFIVMLCLLCAPVYTMPASAATLGEQEIGLLSALGLVDASTDYNQAMTRGDFAALAVQITYTGDLSGVTSNITYPDLDPADANYGAIAVLTNMGVLNGYTNGNFGAGDPITLEQAATVLVRIIGYDYRPGGAMVIASSVDLLENISGDVTAQLTMGDALQLIYNTLNCDISDTNLIDGIAGSRGEDLYMTKRLGIYTVSGVVVDNGQTALSGNSTIADGKVSIDGMEFFNDTGRSDLLGYYVDAYYRTDDSTRENRLFYAYISGRNDVVTIDADNITGLENRTYTYFEDEFATREKRARYSASCDLIYNQMALVGAVDFDPSLLIPEIGSVTLVDNDGDGEYDVLFVQSYRTMIVSTVDTTEQMIYGKNNTPPLVIDDDVTVRVSDGTDDSLTWNSIGGNEVLSVAESMCGKFIDIKKSALQVQATISELQTDGVVVGADGSNYRTTSYFETYGSALEAGSVYTLWLDAFGKIAWAEKTIQNDLWTVAFLRKTGKSGSDIDQSCEMLVFEESGIHSTYMLADKVKVSMEDGTEQRLETDALYNLFQGKTGLIKFRLDDEENICEIELPLNTGVTTDADGRMSLIFDTTGVQDNYKYKSSQQTLGGKILFDGNSKLFNLPSDLEYEDGYKITNCYVLANDLAYVAQGYTTQKNSALAQYCVVVNESSSTFNGDNYPIVVTKLTRTVSEDGDVVTKISGFRQNAAVEFMVDPSGDPLNNIADPMKSGTSYTLGVGDIIRVTQEGNYVNQIQMLYKADMKNALYPESSRLGWLAGSSGIHDESAIGNPYAISGSSTQSALNYLTGNPRVTYGYVYAVNNDILTVTTQNLENETYDPNGGANREYLIHSYKPNYSCFIKADYNKDTVTATNAAITDVRPYTDYGQDCSRVLVLTNSGEMRSIIVINGELEPGA